MTNQPLADTGLRDIGGLDSVSLFPLAPGWWLLIALSVLLLLWGVFALYRWYRRKQAKTQASWQAVAQRNWRIIAQNNLTPRQQLAQSAELLRWAVMQRYGRAQVASLTGQAWLAWLQQHDPDGFAWQQQGQLLVDVAYMPPAVEPDSEAVQAIYHALAAWLR